jgi:hydroxymethylpyrimidine/phosphomethylpyrimidine kinase
MLNKILSEIKPIFTPNLSEVKILLKINEKKRVKISNILENFFENYKTGVVLTDVDVKGKFCIDYILDETKIVRKIKSQRIKSKNTHGTGCTFSSSLAIFLAKGFSLEKSTKLAKSFTRRCIFRAPDFGINYGPLGH